MSKNSRCPKCRKLEKGACPSCKESRRLSQERRIKRLKTAKLCTSCGKKQVTNKTTCDDCINIAKDTASKRNSNCTVCGITRKKRKFIKTKNLCVKCSADQSRNYRIKNPGHSTTKHNEYVQQDFEHWFKCSLITINTRSKKKNKKATITLDDIIQIFERQDKRCALTGILVTHIQKDMKSASIDRIDSNKWYTPDNIQIVCKSINFAKSTHSNDEVIDFINEIAALRK